jgi:antirestriction protein ArdC
MSISTKVADKLNNQILSLIAAGVNPWKRGWNGSTLRPFNAESGRKYNGFNAFMLGCMTPEGRVPAFTTYNATAGRIAKKGSKAIAIVKPLFKDIEKDGVTKRKFFGVAYLNVFSVYDIEGYNVKALEDKYLVKSTGNASTVDLAEKVIADMPNRPSIAYEGTRAFYSPSTDSVTVPPVSAFNSTAEFYSTVFHELGHSTGHVSRLDRKEGMEKIRFGSENYSKEELIAELTACYVCSELGIKDETSLKNSAAYLQGWIKPLQNDPTMILTASTAALKAANYILNNTADSLEEAGE